MTLPLNYLKVRFLPEDNYSCGLAGSVRVGDFTGAGEAWFGNAQVEEFLVALEQFSKMLAGTASLAGGFWKDEQLEQTNLSMRFYLVSAGGVIGAKIELGVNPQDGQRKDSISTVQVELQTNPQQLDRFLNEMKIMMKRKDGEAFLEGC